MSIGRNILRGATSMGQFHGAGVVQLDPWVGYDFFVEIEGLIVGGFRSVSGFSGRIRTRSYTEGGNPSYVHTFTAGAEWPPLRLSHGMTELDGLWSWFDATARGVIRRRDLSISLLDERRRPRGYWFVRDALPVSWTGPELDATQGGLIAVEAIELAHQGISKPLMSSLLGGGLLAADAAGL